MPTRPITMQLLAGEIERLGKELTRHGDALTKHVEDCGAKSEKAEAASLELTKTIKRITDPLDEEDVNIRQAVQKFVGLGKLERSVKRAAVAGLAIILTAVTGSWANLWFQNNNQHQQTLAVVTTKASDRYTGTQAAADKAITDARFRAIEEKLK